MKLAELTGPEESLKSLMQEFRNRYMWFRQELGKAETKEAKEKLISTKHPALEYMPQFYALADKHRHLPVAFNALNTACQLVGMLSDCPKHCGGTFKLVANRLLEDYPSSGRMMSCLVVLSNSSLDEAQSFLRRVSVESKNRKLQGVALYALANSLERGEEGNEKHRAEAIAALERIAKDFADVEINGFKLGKAAEPKVFELKNLAVGCTPPNITGSDATGKTLTLGRVPGQGRRHRFLGRLVPTLRGNVPDRAGIGETLCRQAVRDAGRQ